MSERTIQEIERNAAANPTLETLDRLAEGLRLTLTELVERVEDDSGDSEEDA
jgi:transcriptional regulator with XRE-family HTH domain